MRLIRSDYRLGIFKNKSLTKKNYFIDNLTYDPDSYRDVVIQLPHLSKIKPSDYKGDEYKTKLYALLKLFDQDAQMKNRHRLLLFRKMFPGFLDKVINRLKAADSSNKGLEEQMHREDEIINDLINMNIENEGLKITNKELRQKNRTLEGEKKQLKIKFAKKLKSFGVSIKEIQEETGLSANDIENL